jgi:hypothetical protein
MIDGMGAKPAEDRIEEARSGRSRCRACGVAIEKGELRFGQVLVDGHDFMEWFHLACAQARTPARLAPVLAASELAKAALPPPPDAALGRLIAVERAKGRASCHACERAIAKASLRVAVRLEPDPANPEFARKGFIHLACARGYAEGADVAAYLVKRSTKLAKPDRAALVGVLAAVRLVSDDARGAALAKLARTKRGGALAVLSDWLEEAHDIVLAEHDLAQVVTCSADGRRLSTGGA